MTSPVSQPPEDSSPGHRGPVAPGAIIPPKVVPYLTALVAAALVAGRALPAGHPVKAVADALTDVAVLFGLASPGWRRT
jgi:hypothetical protein